MSAQRRDKGTHSVGERNRNTSVMNIREDLVDYFKEQIYTDISLDTPLIEGGLIDSMGIQELITFIESSYGVEFDMDDLTVEKFGTISNIENLILMKMGKA